MQPPLHEYYGGAADRTISAGRKPGAGRSVESSSRKAPRCIGAVMQSGRLAAMSRNDSDAIAV